MLSHYYIVSRAPHSGIFDGKLSHAQKMKCSRTPKQFEFFSPEFNQTWLSFRYICTKGEMHISRRETGNGKWSHGKVSRGKLGSGNSGKNQPIFRQNSDIFGYFSPEFRKFWLFFGNIPNFWLFSAKITKFLVILPKIPLLLENEYLSRLIIYIHVMYLI